MKKLVEQTDGHLKRDARNLLSVAYKNVVGSRRTSWRVVKGIIEKLEKEEEDERVDKEKAQAKRKLTEDFLDGVVKELKAMCEEVVVRTAPSCTCFCLLFGNVLITRTCDTSKRISNSPNSLPPYLSQSDNSYLIFVIIDHVPSCLLLSGN